jgi:uracil-DNA glycosylase
VSDIQQELLEIVTQVRTHLEYQRALGVAVVESPIAPASTAAPVSQPGNKLVRTAEPAPQEPVKKETRVALSPPAPSGTLSLVREELGECTRCKLSKGRNAIVFGEGNPEARLVFIGEGPGQEEDQQGRPFVGAAGQLLTDIIVKGMQLKREDVYICNIVKCRPPGNRNPEPDEIEACEPFLIKQLQAIRPQFIVALGNVAVKTLLKTKAGITSLRGTWQTYQGIPLMPTFHPAYLLRTPGDKKLVWEDIKKVMAEMEKIKKG